MKKQDNQVAAERDDIRLVELFLSGYKDAQKNTYRISERPDVKTRSEPAIEAVATDSNGHRLAIEHTAGGRPVRTFSVDERSRSNYTTPARKR